MFYKKKKVKGYTWCLWAHMQSCWQSFSISTTNLPPAVFPQNSQLAQHFNEFLKDGYRVSAEAVEVRFPHCDGTRQIHPGSVGISDGFGKVMIMVGICVIIHSLEAWLLDSCIWSWFYSKISETMRDGKQILLSNDITLWHSSSAKELTAEELELQDLRRMLQSFRWVRCAYTHWENPSHFHLHALRFLIWYKINLSLIWFPYKYVVEPIGNDSGSVVPHHESKGWGMWQRRSRLLVHWITWDPWRRLLLWNVVPVNLALQRP